MKLFNPLMVALTDLALFAADVEARGGGSRGGGGGAGRPGGPGGVGGWDANQWGGNRGVWGTNTNARINNNYLKTVKAR